MLNMYDTEKKIRECLLDLRNHSSNPRHLEELEYLIGESFPFIESSKKKPKSNNFGKFPKRGVENIKKILINMLQRTEENKNEQILEPYKNKFRKTEGKDKRNKHTRTSKDVGKQIFKKALSEISSDKELILLHKHQPKLRKRLKKKKGSLNIHDCVESSSINNVLFNSEQTINKQNEKTVQEMIQSERANINVENYKSKAKKDFKYTKNSVLNNKKSEEKINNSKTVRKTIEDIDRSLVSEFGTAVNLSSKIIKQLNLISNNWESMITTQNLQDSLHLQKVLSRQLTCSESVDIKQKSPNINPYVESQSNKNDDSKNKHYNYTNSIKDSKQLTEDKHDSKKNIKKKLKKDKSVVTEETRSAIHLKLCGSNTEVNDEEPTKHVRKPSSTSKTHNSLKVAAINSKDKVDIQNYDSLILTGKRKSKTKKKVKNKLKDSNSKENALPDKTGNELNTRCKSEENKFQDLREKYTSENKEEFLNQKNDKSISKKTKHSKIKLSSSSKSNNKISSNLSTVNNIFASENTCDQVLEANCVNNFKSGDPFVTFQLPERDQAVDKSELGYKLLQTDICSNNSLCKTETVPNKTFKHKQQTNHLSFSTQEQKSTHSLKGCLDLSVNKNAGHCCENVLSVVIKQRKSVQSSRMLRKKSKTSDMDISSNKLNKTHHYKITPQSNKTKLENYNIHENEVKKKVFGFTANINETIQGIIRKSENNRTGLNDTELKNTYCQTVCSEYFSNPVRGGYMKPQIHKFNCFKGRGAVSKKFNHPTKNASSNSDVTHMNKDYISVANIRIPIHVGYNSKLPKKNSSLKVRMVKKKSTSGIENYLHQKKNYLVSNSISVQTVHFCEPIYNKNCNFSLGKFFFQVDLNSNGQNNISKLRSDDHNLHLFQKLKPNEKSQTKLNSFFTIVEDNYESEQNKNFQKNKQPKVSETRKPNYLNTFRNDKYLRTANNHVIEQNNQFSKIVKQNVDNKQNDNYAQSKNTHNGLDCKCHLNSSLNLESNKENFFKILDENSEDNFKQTQQTTVDILGEEKHNPSSTSIGEKRKNQNRKGEAHILNVLTDFIFENYKRQKFVAIGDSKSEIQKSTRLMIDAEIQTESEGCSDEFNAIQKLLTEELKQNRKLFIKNLDEPNNERNLQDHLDVILQLVNNLFEVTSSKVGNFEQYISNKKEVGDNKPEDDIINKLKDIVSIIQNLDGTAPDNKQNFVTVIEDINNGNGDGDTEQKKISDKLDGITQTNGSGDTYHMNTTLMKAQILFNQFNLYLEMIEMLKRYEGIPVDKIETFNEFYKFMDQISGVRKKDFFKINNIENICVLNSGLTPFISSSVEKDVTDTVPEIKTNFVSILHEEKTDASGKDKSNIKKINSFTENMSKLSKNPFFVVLEENVRKDSNCMNINDKECVRHFGKPMENYENFSCIPDVNHNTKIPYDTNTKLLPPNGNMSNSDRENAFFVVIDKNVKCLDSCQNESELTNKKLDKTFNDSQKFEDTDKIVFENVNQNLLKLAENKNIVEKDLCNHKKHEGKETKSRNNNFLNYPKSLNRYYKHENINLNTIEGEDIMKMYNKKADYVRETHINGFKDVTHEEDNNFTLIETGSIIGNKYNTNKNNVESSVKVKPLFNEINSNQIKTKDDHYFIEKSFYVKCKNIRNQSNETFVNLENHSFENCVITDAKNSHYNKLCQKLVIGEEGSCNKLLESRSLIGQRKPIEKKDIEERSCAEKFNKMENKQYFTLKKSPRCNDLWSEYTESNAPNSKINQQARVGLDSKWCASINDCEQNNIENYDFKDSCDMGQHNDIYSFDFNINEYKNDILLNDILSYSDLENLSEDEENNSSWLTIKNINCIKSTNEIYSNENIHQNVMRLEMDLCLNECLQIEVSSENAFERSS